MEKWPPIVRDVLQALVIAAILYVASTLQAMQIEVATLRVQITHLKDQLDETQKALQRREPQALHPYGL